MADDNKCLGEGSRRALAAVIDTFFASITGDEADAILENPHGGSRETSREEQATFLATTGSSAGMVPRVEEAIATVLTLQERTEVVLLLGALNTRLGSSAVLCCLPTRPAFADLSAAEREAALLFLSTSRLGVHRKAFNGLKRLIMGLAMSFVDDDGKNPFWRHIGYSTPTSPKPWKEHDLKSHLLTIDKDTELEVDAVIVGSGAGGGVTAAVLSAQGYSVLVLEKGQLVAPEEVDSLEQPAFTNMYEKSALLTNTTGDLSILAGATFGGGTTINWACCIPTPEHVRKEWADTQGVHRLPVFSTSGEGATESTDFDRSQAAVMARIGASEEGVVHNAANQALLDGCEKLGYHAKTTAQNLRDTSAKSAGWTCFGDKAGNKQGTMVTFLTDAARTGNASFVHNCAVKRVTYRAADAGGAPTSAKRRATGIEAEVDGFALRIKAKRCVVVSCGSLQTPCILQRSGFTNAHIGRHLALHPVTGIVAKFNGKRVHAYEGAPMTTVSNEVEPGPKNDGYGCKLEVPSTHPGLISSSIPWHGGAAVKAHLLDTADAAAMIVLQRDHGTGVVTNDAWNPMGMKVDYAVTDDDKESMIDGMDKCIRILAAAGADEIMTTHSAAHVHRTSDAAALDAYVEKVRMSGIKTNSVGVFSAHQMGSCRMGYSPNTSVVDEDGEMWECDNLYLADASTLPTASAANPMVTTLSISHMIATKLAQRLKQEDVEAGKPAGKPTTSGGDLSTYGNALAVPAQYVYEHDSVAAVANATKRSERRQAMASQQPPGPWLPRYLVAAAVMTAIGAAFMARR